MQASFQTRLHASPQEAELLARFGELYARVEHELFAAFCRTGDIRALDKMKAALCSKHCITARQFNAVSTLLKGKFASKREVAKAALAQVKEDLKGVERSLSRLLKKKTPLTALQRRSWAGKKRRLARLERRKRELSSGHVSLCFGSRKLFLAQFDLAGNGFESHAHWLDAWRAARSSQFYLLGSKDKSSGNQSCTATVAENGTFTLRLRLPDAFIEQPGQKYLMLENV